MRFIHARRGLAALLVLTTLAGFGAGTSPAGTQGAQAAPVGQANAPTAQVVATGLDTPWGMTFAPDGRMFVTERAGRVRVVQEGKLLPDPWLTIDRVVEQSESGLLGIALDPNFASNGYVYLAYTYASSQYPITIRLSRFREDGATKKGIEEKVLVDNIRGANNHDGGAVAFGPDGKLYWGVGERFVGELAQDRSNLNGKILRLNADGSIPADNPFPNSYIYSYGHRNPQGFAWQPGTNTLFATEHGPSGENGCCNDEVNLVEAGKNYGWPLIVGNQTREGLVSPAATSGNSATWAPGGAAFLRAGPWKGSLVFAGLRGNALYRAVIDPNDPRKIANVEPYFKNTYGRIRGLVESPQKDGSFYISTSNRDGRGSPQEGDDKIIRLSFAGAAPGGATLPGSGSRTFPETGKAVTGIFLTYWNGNGALPQQGLPISEVMTETSDLNGRPYTVQYFERAVFEYHPENQAPYNILLSQLGAFRYKAKYPSGAPNQRPSTVSETRLFPETNKRVGGRFLQYWLANGGLAQQGFPISEEFVEKSDLDGKEYLVQYFERAVFEYHPENRAPSDVLLSQLGTFQYRQKYGGR